MTHASILHQDATVSASRLIPFGGATTRIRQRNQRAILLAAGEEFAAKGFEATQTRDIAARAGVPKANLYYYFQSKDNLYAQVLMSFVEPLLHASAKLRESDDPLVALQGYIQARIRIVRDHPHTSKVFSSEFLLGAKQLPEECRHLLQAEARRNVECLRSWIERGRRASNDPEHLMLFIWSATRTYTNLGWQMALITGTATPADSDYANAAAITRMVLGGVTPMAPSANPIVTFTT